MEFFQKDGSGCNSHLPHWWRIGFPDGKTLPDALLVLFSLVMSSGTANHTHMKHWEKDAAKSFQCAKLVAHFKERYQEYHAPGVFLCVGPLKSVSRHLTWMHRWNWHPRSWNGVLADQWASRRLCSEGENMGYISHSTASHCCWWVSQWTRWTKISFIDRRLYSSRRRYYISK